ncbi:MAG TPA: AAA family ATPase [Terriglobales bacterium]
MTSLTIDDLKKQCRWILWRLEKVNGKDSKVPYRPSGLKASDTNPAHWHTFAELEPVAHQFSGIGLVLGTVDSVTVWGIDLDKCCDRATGKFSPESREVVIALDSYTEYSPSGTGVHLWCIGDGELPGPGLQKPYPGAKQIEVKGAGYYQTFTGWHIKKTPATVEERKDRVTALYNRVVEMAGRMRKVTGLSVEIPIAEEEKFKALMAGDTSAYDGDHSRADMALCIMLAHRYGCNAFKIDEQFRESGLYREKWERQDYRETTITKAILAVARDESVFLDDEDTFDDDSEADFLISNPEEGKDGYFPFGEVNCVAGPSGTGKTSLILPALEHIRRGESVWGFHTVRQREYRIILSDRSKKATIRTAKALHLTDDAKQRIIRLGRDAQKTSPALILDKAIRQNPGVSVFFIEGLDLWMPNMGKMEIVGPIIDDLQRVAYRANVCVLASVGSPKQKGKDRYFGRDSMFGSSALPRKVETIIIMALTDETDQNSVRHCLLLPRTAKAVDMYFHWTDQGFTQTEKPPDKTKEDNSAMGRTTVVVRSEFKRDEPIVYRRCLGASSTFYRWRDWAEEHKVIFKSGGEYYLRPTGVTWSEVDEQKQGVP